MWLISFLSLQLLSLWHLLLIVTNVNSNPNSYEGYSVLSVIPRTKLQVDWIHNLTINRDIEYWFTPSSTPNQPIKLLVSPKIRQKIINYLRRHKISVKIEINDLGKAITNDLNDSRADQTLNQTRFGDNFFKSYQRYNVINDYLDHLVSKYPEKLAKSTIGQSFERRNLTLIRVSKSIQRSKHKPIIYLQGGSHGREWISPVTLIYLITSLAGSNDTSIVKLIQFFEYWFVPVVNPDGYEYTHTNNRFWRKTRSKLYDYEPCIGVDPNRNYNYHWNAIGVDNDPCCETYPGPRPLSEPEVKSIVNLILPNSPRIKAFLDFHSFAQSWLIPYGFGPQKPKDYLDMERIAKKSVNALASIHGTRYTVGNKAQLLYTAYGLADDWAKGVAQIKYSFCIELRDKGKYGFLLPASKIIPVGEEMLEAIKVFSQEIMIELKRSKQRNHDQR